jgi:hypothetical protein
VHPLPDLPIGSVQCRYLNASLSPGILFADTGNAVFLILGQPDDYWAIAVSEPRCRGWKLEPGTRDWAGLFVPQTSIIVDSTSYTRDMFSSALIGCVQVTGSYGQLFFMHEGLSRVASAPIAGDQRGNADQQPEAAFPIWRAVLMNRDGTSTNLFERRPT